MRLHKIKESQSHLYKIEFWSYGILIDTYETADINSVREYYVRLFSDDHFAMKLFIDGVRIEFLKAADALMLTQRERFDYGVF